MLYFECWSILRCWYVGKINQLSYSPALEPDKAGERSKSIGAGHLVDAWEPHHHSAPRGRETEDSTQILGPLCSVLLTNPPAHREYTYQGLKQLEIELLLMWDPESALQELVSRSGHTDKGDWVVINLQLRTMATFPGVYILFSCLQTLKALEPCTWKVLPYSEVALGSKSTH